MAGELIALGLCVIIGVVIIYAFDWVERMFTQIIEEEGLTDSDSRSASLRSQIIEGE